MLRSTLEKELTTVCTICESLGLGEVTLAVLKAAHHTTVLVSPPGIVARVQSSEPLEDARNTASREIAIARHLAAGNAPALAPLNDMPGPHVLGSCVVTLWPWVIHARAAEERDAAVAASTLDRVHHVLHDYGGDLPSYNGALEHCWSLLADKSACSTLPAQDRQLLEAQYRRLREQTDATASPWRPLHGDPHLGNLLLGESGALWLDFEDACRGPREYDIACLPASAWSHFADADQALIRAFADLRSICIAVWCWDDPGRSDGAREAAQSNLARVREFAI